MKFTKRFTVVSSFLLGGLCMFGLSKAEALLTFPDLEPGAYYESAAKDMAGAGFITGYSNGNFGPNDAVTRGQVAVIMNRFWNELVRQGVAQPISAATTTRSASSLSIGRNSSSSSSSSSSSTATTGNYFKFAVPTLSPLESTPKVSVSVTRVGSTAGDVTVQYETADGTATGGADYTINSGTLSFNSGETSKVISINLKEDTTDEGAETFTIKLKDPSSGMGIGEPSEVIVTILDNDAGSGGGGGGGGSAGLQGKLGFGAHGYSIAENAGNVTIKVVRTDGTKDAVTVDYLAKGVDTTSEDFSEQSGTLTFADGETEKSFTLVIKNDSESDGYKTVDLFLKNPTAGVVTGLAEVELTIIDDEITSNNPGKLSFTDDDVRITENEGVYYAFVKRTSGATGSVSVDYETSDGTASEYADYTPTSGTLTFAVGEALKAIPVTIIKDDVSGEQPENFIITLSNPTNAAVLITPTSQYVTIE